MRVCISHGEHCSDLSFQALRLEGHALIMGGGGGGKLFTTTNMAQGVLFHALGVLLGRSAALLGLDYGLLGRSGGASGQGARASQHHVGGHSVCFDVLRISVWQTTMKDKDGGGDAIANMWQVLIHCCNSVSKRLELADLELTYVNPCDAVSPCAQSPTNTCGRNRNRARGRSAP